MLVIMLVIRTFDQIINEAAETGKAHVRALAREGNHSPVRLYFRPYALALQSEGCPYDLAADGWMRTASVIPPSLPYDGYEHWLRKHAANLPLFVPSFDAIVMTPAIDKAING